MLLKFFRFIDSRKEYRFVFAGGISELFDIASFILFFGLGMQLYMANSISFGIGAVSGFFMHKYWSFRGEHQFKTHSQFVAYISVGVFNFFLINILVGWFVYGLALVPVLAKLIAIIIAAGVSYTFSNFLIFRNKRQS